MSPVTNECKSSVSAIVQVVYNYQVAEGAFDMWESITNYIATCYI